MATENDQEAKQTDEATAEEKPRRRREAAASAAEAEAAETSEAEEGDAEDEDAGEADAADEAAAEAVEEKPVENRRERRRRKKRGDEGPRDRNAKIRDQLLKKRAEEATAAEPLTAGEMVDDAVARAVAGAGKWLRQNSSAVQTAVVAIVLAGIGYGIWYWRSTSKAESASGDLTFAVMADVGHVDPDESQTKKQPDEEAPIYPVFKTEDQRESTALTAYRKVESAHPGTGAAILARLGEAGVLLDKHAWDDALAAYREVKASQLAAADPDVKGRAIEGIGFALEGKGDRDAALKAFKELETVSGERGMVELGLYHQARLHAMKGEKDQALALIRQARERMQQTPEDQRLAYLRGVLDELHRKIDPASAPRKAPLGGPDRSLTMEELQRIQEQIRQSMEKAKQESQQQGNAPPTPAPAKGK